LDEKGDKGDKGDRGEKGVPCVEDHDLLIRIDSKLDAALKSITDHETRIRSLESSLVKVLGVGAISGFITGWLSRFFGGSP
jgi:hypothetical protein